jgi:peptidyl-prolyl cis-trans isomerase B (cyclophilin B)
MENIRIRIIMENGQEMEAELYPDIAPETVANFTELIRQKFFDGIIFHRVIKGFMIQGGDPTGTGMGGSEKNIKGEFLSNGFVNELKHTRGVLSMARTMDPNSASSQFFIMHEDAPHLDGQYAAFGKVTEGIEIVDAICADTPVLDGNGTVARENQPIITAIRVID